MARGPTPRVAVSTSVLALPPVSSQKDGYETLETGKRKGFTPSFPALFLTPFLARFCVREGPCLLYCLVRKVVVPRGREQSSRFAIDRPE